MSSRDQVTRLIEDILDQDEDDARKSLRKALEPEQWASFIELLVRVLHPAHARTALQSAHIVRTLEGIPEDIRIHAETQRSNMRIQAAAKEPWTYQWIKAMPPGGVLYDIGANIGAYTLIAAKTGQRVVAFEPHQENYRDLCRNLALNGLEAVALPLALSDRSELLCNPIFAGEAGQTMALGEAGPRNIVADRLDDIVGRLSLPQPDHIKIDVDGYEVKALSGATAALSSAKSVLIEVDTRVGAADRRSQITSMLSESGLSVEEAGSPAEGVVYLVATR